MYYEPRVALEVVITYKYWPESISVVSAEEEATPPLKQATANAILFAMWWCTSSVEA